MTVQHHLRHDAVDRAVGQLLGCHISQPLLEEFLHIVVDGSGLAEHLGVTGPTQPLVSLGAIGGDIQVVALLTPNDVVVQLIDLLVAAGEITGALHFRMHHHRPEGVQIHRFQRIFLQPHVAEALEGVGRLVNFLTTTEDIGHLIGSRAHIALVEIALLVQYLCVAQHNFAATLSCQANFHIAGHILTKIQHQFPLGCADQLHGSKPLLLGDPLADLGNQLVLVIHGDSLAQIGRLQGLVHGLAVVKFRIGHLASIGIPAFVGEDGFLGAVGIHDLQPGNDGLAGEMAAVLGTHTLLTQRPANTHADLQQIFPTEHSGHIIFLVLHPGAIVGKAGSKYALTDAAAV